MDEDARAAGRRGGADAAAAGRWSLADSGNGVSSALDWRRFSFVNVDLSVHLERLPGGEWVCLDAVTLPQPGGFGTSDSLLLDERGRIGRALQTLLVSAR